MSVAPERARRGAATRWIWRGLWLALALLFALLALDAWRRGMPPVVWALLFLPLVVLLPGLARDRLRSMTWLSFVTLLYFVAAVQRLFAEPASATARLELLAVITLFLCSMFYVRQRARELRAVMAATSEE